MASEVDGFRSRLEDAVRAQREMESNHAASNKEHTLQITRKIRQITELERNLERAKVGLESKSSTINELRRTLESQEHHVKNLRERTELAERGLDAARSLHEELRRVEEENEKAQRDRDKVAPSMFRSARRAPPKVEPPQPPPTLPPPPPPT